MSTASRWVSDILHDEFENMYTSRANCRKIKNSSKYSQHSWPNALDVTNRLYGYSTLDENQAYLDEVVEFLWDNRVNLSIKMILWRGKSWFTNNPVSGHQDHIHVDFWPTGYSPPPCAGGSLRYEYSSGRTVYGDPGPENGMNETNDPRPTPPPTDEGDYVMPTLELWAGYSSKGKGHLRQSVRALQIMLAGAGYADKRSADNLCAADGWFGQGTDAETRSFQRAYNLVVDGKVGRLTWAALVAATN